MIVYTCGLVLSLFFSYFAFDKIHPEKEKSFIQKSFAFMSAVPLAFISSFRYGIGNDYFGYVDYFETVNRINYMEYGFDFILKTIRSFTNNYMWMFLICSVIFFYFIFRGIYEQSKNPTLSIFLLVCAPYYFEFFSGMRQMIAVAIFFYSIKFIKKRKMVPYMLLTLLATSFHSSAIVFFPVYFIYYLKLTPTICMLLLSSIVLLRPVLKKYLITLLATTKYIDYIEMGSNAHFGIVTLIVPLFIFIFAMLFYNQKNYKNNNDSEQKEYQLYCNLMFVQVVVVLIQDFGTYFARIGWGFGISQIILIPLILSRIKNKKDQLFLTVIICFLFITYVLINRFAGGGGSLLPFRWIFEINN